MRTLDDYRKGYISHYEYFAQFVTNEIKNEVINNFGIERLKYAMQHCTTFNNIALEKWDRLAYLTKNPIVLSALNDAGDCWSLACAVCILKAAARIAVLDLTY